MIKIKNGEFSAERELFSEGGEGVVGAPLLEVSDEGVELSIG